ncbi:hypothetical protein KC217_23595, partial [Mycobacterium tuberculosis]|nr:hypothetical protein [Mycobacterium tuberculosis]
MRGPPEQERSRKDRTKAHKREAQNLPQIKSSSIYKGLKNLWSNSLQKGEHEAGLPVFIVVGVCIGAYGLL